MIQKYLKEITVYDGFSTLAFQNGEEIFFEKITVDFVDVRGPKAFKKDISFEVGTSSGPFFVIKIKFHKRIFDHYTLSGIARIIDNVLFLNLSLTFVPVTFSKI